MENIQTQANKNKFQNIDFLRFLFTIFIVYFHLLHSNIMKYTNTQLYDALADKNTGAVYIFECFFIIAGFFLFQSFKNDKYKDWSAFVVKKIIKLSPMLIFSILITILASFFFESTTSLHTHILNMLFLQCIGVTLDFRGINWIVSSYFWAVIFYFYILKSFKKEHAFLIIAICTYFSLVGTINNSSNFGRETINIFFNLGLMRALFGLGIGFFTGVFYNSIKDGVKDKFNTIKSFILFSILEILLSGFLIKYFLFSKLNCANKFIYIFAFLSLFILFLIKKGILSKIFENKYLAFFGKYSYSIYVMQQISFWILAYTLWKNTGFVSNIPLSISTALIFAVILGISTHYLIEKPIFKYLNRRIES